MSSKIVYEATSRVVNENKEVVGFMVRMRENRRNLVFMSLEVLTFGLANNTFSVVNVKLGGNNKPRGCNGFLLSKLPIENLRSSEEVFDKLIKVLNYIVKDMVNTSAVKYSRSVEGVIAVQSITFMDDDYKGLDVELAEDELNKTLKFYQKHLPKEWKEEIDNVGGTVLENGLVSVSVSKSLVMRGNAL